MLVCLELRSVSFSQRRVVSWIIQPFVRLSDVAQIPTTYCSQNIQKDFELFFFPYSWNWVSDHRSILNRFFQILFLSLSLSRRCSFSSSRNLSSPRKDCVTSQKNVCKGGYYPLPSLRISPSHPTPETKNSLQNKTQQNVKRTKKT